MTSSAFSRFPDQLQAAITSRLGWTSLRPVQELAGHAILDGYNTIVLAPTAGGKTEASMFPLLAQMVESEPNRSIACYLVQFVDMSVILKISDDTNPQRSTRNRATARSQS
jgi:Lhr-like helicase